MEICEIKARWPKPLLKRSITSSLLNLACSLNGVQVHGLFTVLNRRGSKVKHFLSMHDVSVPSSHLQREVDFGEWLGHRPQGICNGVQQHLLIREACVPARKKHLWGVEHGSHDVHHNYPRPKGNTVWSEMYTLDRTAPKKDL